MPRKGPNDSIFYQVNELYRIQAPFIKITSRVTYTDKDNFQEDLARIRELFFGEGLDRLAQVALKPVIRRTVERLYSPGVGQYETSAGSAGGDSLAALLPLIAIALQSIQRVDKGKYGFASKSALDAIKMQSAFTSGKRSQAKMEDLAVYQPGDTRNYPTTRKRDNRDSETESSRGTYSGGQSKYNIAWQIAEFGTGKYAYPDKRLPGDPTDLGTKVPGGGGSWYLNPRNEGLKIMGQEGAHFLFGERKTAESVRGDIDEALKAVSLEIRKILRI